MRFSFLVYFLLTTHLSSLCMLRCRGSGFKAPQGMHIGPSFVCLIESGGMQ